MCLTLASEPGRADASDDESTLAAASFPTAAPGASAQVSILVLGVASTATDLLLYFALITEAGPSRASVITYVNPLVAVALAVALLGERSGSAATAGVALVLAGSWLSTGQRPGVRDPT